MRSVVTPTYRSSPAWLRNRYSVCGRWRWASNLLLTSVAPPSDGVAVYAGSFGEASARVAESIRYADGANQLVVGAFERFDLGRGVLHGLDGVLFGHALDHSTSASSWLLFAPCWCYSSPMAAKSSTAPVQMTQRIYGPDGQEFGTATTSVCPGTWPAELARKRRRDNLVEISDGIEFDTYRPGYWDGQEDAAYLNALRTRITFAEVAR